MPRADGGGDSEDNCIALCFNCHADVAAYNPRHPKGKRYTAEELKEHRDAWFGKIADSPGLPADEQLRDLDFKLFKRLWSWLGTPVVQEFLKNHHFGGSFLGSERRPLSEFRHRAGRPEFEFFDADLERMRVGLVIKMDKFLNRLAMYTAPVDVTADTYGIPSELHHRYPRRWNREVAILNGRATQLFEDIAEFARYARRKLRFDFDELGIDL